MKGRFCLIVLVLAGLPGPAARSAESPLQFRDVTKECGVAFTHTDGGSGRRYIVETVSAGLAAFDYDGDGLVDLYFLNGTPLPGTTADPPPRCALYKNLGNWKFEDVTERAGVGRPGYALGVAAADFDNDGRIDLYVSCFGPNTFYRNNGDGTFTDVTRQTGTAAGGAEKVGAGAAFLDIDGDGHLDLYVANYLRFSYDKHVTARMRGVETYAGQGCYAPLPDSLFRNRGDGTFADVSRPSGIASRAAYGMGIVAADYDDDGAVDLFVANDGMANILWQNDGTGKFTDVGLEAGVAYDFSGKVRGSMGVDCGDYNNDGLLDFFHTAYQTQHATLYQNRGGGLFDDVTLATGAGTGTVRNVTWGCSLVDFDNDGDRDLFIACGHLLDNVDQFDRTTSYRARNILLKNLLAETGQAKFVDVSDQCGDGLKAELSSRGAIFDDLDNDGDVDIVVLNSRERPTVLRNMLMESGSKNHWLEVRLQGVKANRDGVGARVRVTAGDLVQIDEVHSGRGYQSHYGARLHFGLGRHARIDQLEVRWPGGGVDVLRDVAPDRVITLVEGNAGR